MVYAAWRGHNVNKLSIENLFEFFNLLEVYLDRSWLQYSFWRRDWKISKLIKMTIKISFDLETWKRIYQFKDFLEI